MIKVSRWLRIISKTIIPILTGAAFSCLSGPASAYVLYDPTTCSPGQKWDVTQPVKVRLLGDSVFAYLNGRGTSASLRDLDRLNRDVEAVIDLYNTIPGCRLKLELAPGISGDSDLDEPAVDNFGAQTIVVGFTKDLPKDDPERKPGRKSIRMTDARGPALTSGCRRVSIGSSARPTRPMSTGGRSSPATRNPL